MIGTIQGSTNVTFPANSVRGTSVLVGVVPTGQRWGVVTEETPFHPVDHTWPDHPADLGTITVDATVYPVVDCVIGAARMGTGEVLVGEDIPARRGAGDWHWLVLHVVEGQPADAPGTPVALAVDPVRRDGLSAGHTACELVTLAINKALAERWRKDVPTDVLGSPNFDGAAITTSRIFPYGSQDEYRLGKSLRKKGFVTEGLAEDLPVLTDRINELMAGWVDQNARVWVDAPQATFSAVRTWNCALREAMVVVPCGGTHVTATGQLGTVAVTLRLNEDCTELVMDTRLTPA
ncbi:MAG TPA: metal-dependent hydrolase [Pseudonocardiaceae bacterium]|nr:metal-dependent hydrolase [Pseudonocardiaceae bacterium]